MVQCCSFFLHCTNSTDNIVLIIVWVQCLLQSRMSRENWVKEGKHAYLLTPLKPFSPETFKLSKWLVSLQSWHLANGQSVTPGPYRRYEKSSILSHQVLAQICIYKQSGLSGVRASSQIIANSHRFIATGIYTHKSHFNFVGNPRFLIP